MTISTNVITTAIAWCLTWGEKREPQFDLTILQQMRQALNHGTKVPEETQSLVEQVQQLQSIHEKDLPQDLNLLKATYPSLWNQTIKIGLAYGGATKIKQYVFEASKLPDIRGASALLDRINLVDLPAFFGKGKKSISTSKWLREHFPGLEEALIPELIIYSTGGNILAFCPAAFIDDLANAIEKRYAEETLIANSCAVGDTFKLLEIRFGLLHQSIEDTPWLEWYRQNHTHSIVQAYFGSPTETELTESFRNRKSFNELTTKLAVLFNQRRSGNNWKGRPSRCYPPMFETHPYLMRDEGDHRSAIVQVEDLPENPKLSEALARKRIVGQIAKQEVFQENLPSWFKNLNLEWQPTGIKIKSWVTEFEEYLAREENHQVAQQYYTTHQNPEEARTLRELGNVYKGFVAYIYADGNNMGGYIQNIKTPEAYQQFSQDIVTATEKSVYHALAKHLKPHKLVGLSDPDNKNRNDQWIHPFEIVTIGGDDVMLIVPANKALAIAQTIGEEFEHRLLQTNRYSLPSTSIAQSVHRYLPKLAPISKCQLSMSTGVLITAKDTPIYYAKKLVDQLLKSAKKKAKDLKNQGYNGGTVDFFVMKSVTMLSSSIEEFRQQALTIDLSPKRQLYAAPYTLYELKGLLSSVKVLQGSKFPKSQLYQIRSLLERGKHTAILNYRYFRVRLKQGQRELQEYFEEAWCKPKDEKNRGNLAPWISRKEDGKTTYETIWNEMVELYDFIDELDSEISTPASVESES
jgi:CRISPR-associated protein Cmr2